MWTWKRKRQGGGDGGTTPLCRCMGLFMDKMVGPDFEAGLAHLNALAEKP